DLEVERGEHVLQGAELLVELAGGQARGLAEGGDRGGPVAGAGTEQLERGVEEPAAPFGPALLGGLPGVAPAPRPDVVRHRPSPPCAITNFVVYAVLWRRPSVPTFQ